MSLSKQLRTFLVELTDLKKLDECVSRKNRETHPIVSFTSVPQRLELIKGTLVSLLKQSVPPKEIHINLGENLFKTKALPAFLRDLKTVKIFWIEKDCGPATKYLPTLERFENVDQLLIICDDDMYYSKNLLKCLIEADKAGGSKSCYCINGLRLPADFKSESRPSDKAIKSGMKKVAIVEGCGGYSLRPKFVDVKALKNKDGAPARAYYDDDFWLSGHLSRRHIEKFQIVAGRRKSLANTTASAITGDRAQLQTDLMAFFKNDWAPDEIEPPSENQINFY